MPEVINICEAPQIKEPLPAKVLIVDDELEYKRAQLKRFLNTGDYIEYFPQHKGDLQFEKQHRSPIIPIHVIKQTGRNDKCPCGSGRKYKKCCGK